jgi:PAS domain S-box-containing protein
VHAVAGATHDANQQPDEMFRLLVDSVQDYAIFMLDPAGNVTSWNQGAARIKGYEADEIVGKHFSVFYQPDDVAAGVCDRELEQAKADGRVEAEGWRVRKDGSLLWASVVITALYDDDGSVRGFAKVTRDNTERKAAEDAARHLDELRLRQRHALEVNDDIIQGLAVVDLALNLGDYEKAQEVVGATLESARRFVTELLGDENDVLPIVPGDLRRREHPTGD